MDLQKRHFVCLPFPENWLGTFFTSCVYFVQTGYEIQDANQSDVSSAGRRENHGFCGSTEGWETRHGEWKAILLQSARLFHVFETNCNLHQHDSKNASERLKRTHRAMWPGRKPTVVKLFTGKPGLSCADQDVVKQIWCWSCRWSAMSCWSVLDGDLTPRIWDWKTSVSPWTNEAEFRWTVDSRPACQSNLISFLRCCWTNKKKQLCSLIREICGDDKDNGRKSLPASLLRHCISSKQKRFGENCTSNLFPVSTQLVTVSMGPCWRTRRRTRALCAWKASVVVCRTSITIASHQSSTHILKSLGLAKTKNSSKKRWDVGHKSFQASDSHNGSTFSVILPVGVLAFRSQSRRNIFQWKTNKISGIRPHVFAFLPTQRTTWNNIRQLSWRRGI